MMTDQQLADDLRFIVDCAARACEQERADCERVDALKAVWSVEHRRTGPSRGTPAAVDVAAPFAALTPCCAG